MTLTRTEGTRSTNLWWKNMNDKPKDDMQPIVIDRAAFRAHWPTGPVLLCKRHANGLVAIGEALGSHTHLESYVGEERCISCLNAAKSFIRGGW